MEKNRQIKIISMIALVVAIAGMTLGFAAFSKVLTITSSAQVTPNEEDFKVVTYGLKDEDSLGHFDATKEFEDHHLSSEIGLGYSWNDIENDAVGTTATISNNKNNTTISNINVTFSKESSSYLYYFIIKNEGKYDAYINLEDFENYDMSFSVYNGVCTIENETKITQEELDAVCEKTYITTSVYNFENDYISGTEEKPYYKLPAGDYIWLEMYINTNKGSIIAEPYNVEFEDITINFSTSP